MKNLLLLFALLLCFGCSKDDDISSLDIQNKSSVTQYLQLHKWKYSPVDQNCLHNEVNTFEFHTDTTFTWIGYNTNGSENFTTSGLYEIDDTSVSYRFGEGPIGLYLLFDVIDGSEDELSVDLRIGESNSCFTTLTPE